MSQQKKHYSAETNGGKKSVKGRRKKRRINRLRATILLFVLILMIAVVTIAVMLVSSPDKADTQSGGNDTALFGVKSIVVEGNSHYIDSQIIDASGVYVGQSLFFVNKRRAAENILKGFPYVEKVTISNPSFSQIKILIDEAKPVGITENKSGWLIIGDNGKGLEQLPQNSSRTADYRIFKCNLQKTADVGHLSLDDRSLMIINIMTTAFKDRNLDEIPEIDLSEFTDLRFNWKGSIEIKLGSDTDLEPKLGYALITLDRVLDKHGENAAGQIDLNMYSEASPKAVFTPEDLLL